MTKPRKASPRPRPRKIDDEQAASKAAALLDRSIALLDRLLATAEGTLDRYEKAEEAIEPTTMREFAGVGRAAATLAAELRAREKQQAAIVKKLSPKLVVAYLRQLSVEERARHFRQSDAGDGRSVLA